MQLFRCRLALHMGPGCLASAKSRLRLNENKAALSAGEVTYDVVLFRSLAPRSQCLSLARRAGAPSETCLCKYRGPAPGTCTLVHGPIFQRCSSPGRNIWLPDMTRRGPCSILEARGTLRALVVPGGICPVRATQRFYCAVRSLSCWQWWGSFAPPPPQWTHACNGV